MAVAVRASACWGIVSAILDSAAKIVARAFVQSFVVNVVSVYLFYSFLKNAHRQKNSGEKYLITIYT